ncbi:hypothetical protein [Cohnella boryungensis]|uniref:hypothetical protein n=1 Tax=Cohnella boryungensis TaxID=768479 RepID=UPI00195DBD13
MSVTQEKFVDNVLSGLFTDEAKEKELAVTFLSLLEKDKSNDFYRYVLNQYTSGRGVNSSEMKMSINGVIKSGKSDPSLTRLFNSASGEKGKEAAQEFNDTLIKAKTGTRLR